MIPIDVLVRPVTSDDIQAKALDMLESVGIPAKSWRVGGVALTLLTIMCLLAGMGASMLTSIVSGLYLAFARGDYLTAHAKDVYDVDRIAATFATGPVTLTNKGGGVYTIGANQLIVRCSTTFARFRVTDAFTLGAGSDASPTSVVVNVVAVVAGAGSSVGPTEINELETTLAKVSVSNPSSIIGRDAETDDQIVTRCKAKKGTWSPFGPRDAYVYAALSATMPDGSATNITRVSVSRYSSKNTVDVICATPSGTPSDDELTAVRTNLELLARPDSTTVNVIGATTLGTSKNITIWANGGTDTVILANAQKALDAFIIGYPIGGLTKVDGGTGYLFADALEAAIIASSPQVFDVDLDDESDIALTSTQVAVDSSVLAVRVR